MPGIVRPLICLSAGLLLFGLDSATRAQTSLDLSEQRVNETIERFDITLPIGTAFRSPVLRALEELTRERCDQIAIENLAKALEKAGQRRDAAKVHIRFSETCKGHAPSLQAAVNILLSLSDYAEAARVADGFIALEPLNDNGYFLRALANDRGGESKKAIDDYISAIELFQPKARIADVSFVGLARSYDRVGQSCDAAMTIESWVALNPAQNDTIRARTLIQGYLKKGDCSRTTAGGEDIFPATRQGGVIVIPLAVNGVRGRFMIDTGAAYVGMKLSFAEKAKVQVDRTAVVKMLTANGIGEGMLGRASQIKLKTLERKDIQVIVQTDTKGTYGDGVDGLLGMNFLSHFLVSIDSKSIRIRSRAQR